MARRNKTSLVNLIALMPWWAGVVLAILSYALLHYVATQPLPSVKPGQVGAMMTRGLATGGQYILPLICLVGAAASAWKRRERKALVQDVVQSKSADALDGMTWQQFEQLVGEGFRAHGYTVTETGGGGADGGVDLVLRKGSEKYLVQCKQWRAFKVGVDVVRELYGVMAAKGATGGFVVTSGRFTDEATSFAAGRNVKLVDGPKLLGLIRQAQAGRGVDTEPSFAPSVWSSTVPACPRCSKAMVRRVAKRGANAGGEFWGCTGYPVCKGTSGIA